MQTFPGKSKDFLKTHRQTSGKPKSTSFILHAELSTPHYKIMWMIKYFNSWFTKYECRLLNQQKITDEEIADILKEC